MKQGKNSQKINNKMMRELGLAAQQKHVGSVPRKEKNEKMEVTSKTVKYQNFEKMAYHQIKIMKMFTSWVRAW